MEQIQTVKIEIAQLQPGMYVSALDRPWLETPFHLQGFIIRDKAEIEKLGMFCQFVYVDTRKSLAGIKIPANSFVTPQKKAGGEKQAVATVPFSTELASRKITQYIEQTTVADEIQVANANIQRVKKEFDNLMFRLNHGHTLHVAKLQEVVRPLVDSIIRNPGANIWLAKLKSKDSYTYRHCLAVSIWCSVLGRQIGLPKKELQQLALGGMLLDIGKLKIPRQVLDKQGKLNDREFSLMQKHVDLSLKMAKESPSPVPQSVLDMIAYHHERFNGSGYPHKLEGSDIPLYARIAAIADCYDAMTSLRAYAEPTPHSDAVKKLYDWRGFDFQPELVEAFIQSIGIYPTGSMVELTTGEVGVVIKENPRKRLRPQILVILDKQKELMDEFLEIDLLELADAGHEEIEIAKSLEPGAYGLDPEALYI